MIMLFILEDVNVKAKIIDAIKDIVSVLKIT